jgi:hypothetical protein
MSQSIRNFLMKQNSDPKTQQARSASTPLARTRWMTVVLWAAGIYNLIWGAAVVLFPSATLAWLHFPPQPTPQLWQCIGMIVGVYGIGYALAARDPLRLWPLVLVGLLGKVFGPIGFLQAALAGELPWSAGLICVTNDLIWWIPFAQIVYRGWCSAGGTRLGDRQPAADQIDHVAIPVTDVASAVEWYQRQFRCRVTYQDATWAMLEFANLRLAFVIAEQHPPHIAFSHPQASSFGPLKTHRDGTRSCYTADVAGNVIEMLQAEPVQERG